MDVLHDAVELHTFIGTWSYEVKSEQVNWCQNTTEQNI